MLGSDGLFDVLPNKTISRLVGKMSSSAQKVCNELVKEVMTACFEKCRIEFRTVGIFLQNEPKLAHNTGQEAARAGRHHVNGHPGRFGLA